MLILPVKGIDDAAIATIVVGRIQYLKGDSEHVVQVPFPHVVTMTAGKHMLERVDHQIFSPKQFCMFSSSPVEGAGLTLGCPTCSISSFTVRLIASIMLVFDS